ncbi:hypothetical protein BOTNAR_0048g00170 [Botryotinia narcissicola]|uniref:Uncharacterized protein n=1 Tax=Botryotinia narcissicola TaxID=278944 RepID=A0A4Z1JDQ8_9HELO|nr:hypothetical protein BOTNAR_0048g00170 [Botryotinia narcissicola]
MEGEKDAVEVVDFETEEEVWSTTDAEVEVAGEISELEGGSIETEIEVEVEITLDEILDEEIDKEEFAD